MKLDRIQPLDVNGLSSVDNDEESNRPNFGNIRIRDPGLNFMLNFNKESDQNFFLEAFQTSRQNLFIFTVYFVVWWLTR